MSRMDVCFIIPLHHKNFHFAREFITQVNGVVDIYIVFACEQDYNDFCFIEGYFPIIIPNNYSLGDSIVTNKKFYTLKYLLDSNYDYMITCDSEIKIVPENFTKENIIQKIVNIFENKYIYAGICSDPNIYKVIYKISTTSGNVFSNQDMEKLSKITNNFLYYTWWSDIPVYKTEHLKHFFSKIDTTNLTWHHFDHVMYLYYLLLYHDFVIIDVTELVGHSFSLECYCTTEKENINKLLDKKYGFGWTTQEFYRTQTEFLRQQGTFLLYHIDHHP